METPISGDLLRVATALQRRLSARARIEGIRWSGLMTLADLEAHGPLTQRRLAARQQVRPATMSLLVRELRAEGLVEETPDPRDARRRNLRLTRAGAARLARDRERLAAPLAEAFVGLHAGERDALAVVLPALLRIFD